MITAEDLGRVHLRLAHGNSSNLEVFERPRQPIAHPQWIVVD